MTVPLVLSFQSDAAYVLALEALNRLGVTVRRTAPMFRTIAVTVPEALVQQIQALPGLTQSVRDVPVRPAVVDIERALGLYPESQAGPARTWEDFTVLEPEAIAYMRVPAGLTGKGVRVAVVDTGIDSGHPALRGRVKETIVVAENANPLDGVGHGTHVAGTIAGQAVDSPRGPWHGIAPDAEIVNIPVLDSSGEGTLSDVLAGFEAAANARVQLVNASLGSPVDFLVDPLADAIETLAGMGILCVVAAGNSGPAPFTIGTPGSAPAAVTVGAASVPITSYLTGGETAEFSSRGPTLRSWQKPDVAAPGGAGNTGVGTQRPEMIYGPSAGMLDALVDGEVDGWAPLRGTSQATPHVTGLLALLLEKYRFTRAQLLDGIAATSRRGAGVWKDYDQGWGFLDGAALAQYLRT